MEEYIAGVHLAPPEGMERGLVLGEHVILTEPTAEPYAGWIRAGYLRPLPGRVTATAEIPAESPSAGGESNRRSRRRSPDG